MVDIHAHTKKVVEEKGFIYISRNSKEVSSVGIDLGINKQASFASFIDKSLRSNGLTLLACLITLEIRSRDSFSEEKIVPALNVIRWTD
jgi:hypothetical protein